MLSIAKLSMTLLLLTANFIVQQLSAQTCLTTNIAAGKPGYSSTPAEEASAAPSGISDGNLSTICFFSTSGEKWRYVDLQAGYVICRVLIKWELWNHVADFKLQGSNNATDWTDLYTNTAGAVADQANGFSYNDITLSGSTAYQYLRVFMPYCPAWGGKFKEVEVYNKTASATGNWGFSGNSISAGQFIGTTNSEDLVFKTNGTTNAKLTAGGIFVARKIQVTQTGWADFVFDKSYKLRPLAEVETFIKKHKHLPDVPSEKEVLQNGVNVGDNQAVLLRKIEELTLYIIELNNKLQEQDKKIRDLEIKAARKKN